MSAPEADCVSSAGEKTARQIANDQKRLAKLEKFKAKQDKQAIEKAERAAKESTKKEIAVDGVVCQSQQVIPETPYGQLKGDAMIHAFFPSPDSCLNF